MAHFAQLDENNIVIDVKVVNNEVILDDQGIENEQIGIEFCKSLFGQDTNWVQTSFNANFRFHYAGIGYTYNPDLDAFVPPKTFPSWSLNETTIEWDPPKPQPQETQENVDNLLYYAWDEDLQEWVLKSLKGPTAI